MRASIPRILPPALLLLLALTACGDSGGDSTGDSTGSSTGSPTGDSTTGEGPTTSVADTSSTGEASTTPTTGDDTTGDATTDATTTDATTGGLTADCEFDDSVLFSRMGTIWQLRSDDGETCVWLERRDDSEPDTIYKAVPYTLLEIKVGHAGQLAHLTEQAKMSWESTHHNWMDVAEAWDDAVRFRLEDKYPLDPVEPDFVDRFDVSAIDEQTDAVLWGPIRLHPYVP